MTDNGPLYIVTMDDDMRCYSVRRRTASGVYGSPLAVSEVRSVAVAIATAFNDSPDTEI